MICVSIGEATVSGCMMALRGLKFAEVRIDRLREPGEEGVRKIFSLPLRTVATCRPGKLKDRKRLALLRAAIEAGAGFVDIEVEGNSAYKKAIVALAAEMKCQIIVSYHNHRKTPSDERLGQVVDRCFDSGAGIAKIACRVRHREDNARLLGLLDDCRDIVVIGMGGMGKITRIMAPLLGSPFTFASLGDGKETAMGQIGKDALAEAIGSVGNALRRPGS